MKSLAANTALGVFFLFAFACGFVEGVGWQLSTEHDRHADQGKKCDDAGMSAFLEEYTQEVECFPRYEPGEPVSSPGRGK